MLQAIRTQYFGPAAIRGSRIKAECAGGFIMVEYDDALNANQNHCAAAKRLAKKLGWIGADNAFVGGTIKDGSRVWVVQNDRDYHENRDKFTAE